MTAKSIVKAIAKKNIKAFELSVRCNIPYRQARQYVYHGFGIPSTVFQELIRAGVEF